MQDLEKTGYVFRQLRCHHLQHTTIAAGDDDSLTAKICI